VATTSNISTTTASVGNASSITLSDTHVGPVNGFIVAADHTAQQANLTPSGLVMPTPPLSTATTVIDGQASGASGCCALYWLILKVLMTEIDGTAAAGQTNRPNAGLRVKPPSS
jgi:hypothetical protein